MFLNIKVVQYISVWRFEQARCTGSDVETSLNKGNERGATPQWGGSPPSRTMARFHASHCISNVSWRSGNDRDHIPSSLLPRNIGARSLMRGGNASNRPNMGSIRLGRLDTEQSCCSKGLAYLWGCTDIGRTGLRIDTCASC